MEIERKFLIAKPSWEQLEEHASDHTIIVQTYLLDDGYGGERRIRQRGSSGNWTLYFTEKFPTASAYEREEIETEISAADYIELMALVDIERGQVSKERWVVPWLEHDFEIDIYPFSDTLAIMEVELALADEPFSTPDFIDIIREVSEDPAYRNSSLALSHML